MVVAVALVVLYLSIPQETCGYFEGGEYNEWKGGYVVVAGQRFGLESHEEDQWNMLLYAGVTERKVCVTTTFGTIREVCDPELGWCT